MQPATNGTDERLDELIDIGRQAVDAIKALLPDEPGLVPSPDATIPPAPSPDVAIGAGAKPEPCEVKEPARRRKKP